MRSPVESYQPSTKQRNDLFQTGDPGDSYSTQSTLNGTVDGMIMRDLPLPKTESSLLPLREKLPPHFVIGYEGPAKLLDNDLELTDSVGRGVRLLSISSSPHSTNSSKCDGASERSLAPPFTPPSGVDKETVQGTKGFLLRRPSEHYLEVLGDYKATRTLPKISPPTSLPPLRKVIQEGDLRNISDGAAHNMREGHLALTRNRNSFVRALDHDTSRVLRIADVRRESTPSCHTRPSGKLLRKTHSLPVIRSCNTVLTSGEDKLAMLHALPDRSVTLGNTNLNHSLVGCEEDSVEQECDENEDMDNQDKGMEMFNRICHWLKECEDAR